MSTEQSIEKTIDDLSRTTMNHATKMELAKGYIRWRALKSLTPQQLSALVRSNIVGGDLDAEMDKIAITIECQK